MHRLSDNLILSVVLVFFLCTVPAVDGYSQSTQTDLTLIRLAYDIPVSNKSGLEELHIHRKHSSTARNQRHSSGFIGRNALERYNPISVVLAGSLYGYQHAISPQLSNRCIYHPSCSVFSREIITERGLLPGVILTADRIARCNRISAMDTPQHRLDYELGRIVDETGRYHK